MNFFCQHMDWVHGILLVFGLLLFFRPFSAEYLGTSRLLRNALFLAGFLAVACGASHLLAWYGYIHHFLSHNVRAVLAEIHRVSLGGSAGLLILLLSSSEFWKVEYPRRKRRSASAELGLSTTASH